MARVNYREVAGRFTHIDARFVACQVGLPENDGFFTVSLYPWWEHPHYLAARDAGTRWGFAQTDSAYRPVTVYPKRVHEVRLSRSESVIDWDFTLAHPLLWPYEQSGQITCNSPISLDQWMQMSATVLSRLTGYNRRAELTDYVPLRTLAQRGGSGSFSLGRLPRTLFLVVRQVLEEQGVRYYAPSEPKATEVPVLFLIDEEDYIIADDFEVEVPEFEHKPEWFRPG